MEHGIKEFLLHDDLQAKLATILDKLPKGSYTGTATDLHNDIVAISTGVQGVGATVSNSPTGTGVASWLFAGGGTYTNYGGLVIPANYVGFIIRSASDFYSYVGFELDLTGYIGDNDLHLEIGKNKYSSTTHIINNQGIDNIGNIGYHLDWTGAKIPVNENTTYSLQNSFDEYRKDEVGCLAYLDSNGLILSFIDMNGLSDSISGIGKTLTTPIDTHYIFLNVEVLSREFINTFQIELGSSATGVELYTSKISKIKDSELIDLHTKSRVVMLENETHFLSNEIKQVANFEISAKENNLGKIQPDIIFDLNGVSFIAGDLFTLEVEIDSESQNISENVTVIPFQNNSNTPLNVSGSQIGEYSIGTYAGGTVLLSENKPFSIDGFRYLHLFICFQLENSSQQTDFILQNIKLTVNSEVVPYLTTSELYNANTNDTIIYNEYRQDNFVKFKQLQNSLPNYLIGKKLEVIGDSMVKGHSLSNDNTWLYLIGQRNNMITGNYGINGTQLTNENSFGSSVLNRYAGMSNDADYIGVFALTNDADAGVPIGLDSDSYAAGQLTVKGALNDLSTGILNKYPNKKVFYITPYNRNSNTQSYINAMITIAKKYSIPVFDNWTNGGINFNNTAQVNSLTLGDGYHLNNEGMIYASHKYEAFIRSL